MDQAKMFKYLLDSFKEPVMFIDTEHIIRYLNPASAKRYKIRTTYVDRSIFKCHNENSKNIMLDAYKCLESGEEEKMLPEDKQYRMFMRAVRDEEGTLLGYYVRFEPKANEGTRADQEALPHINSKESAP
jgi:hypothetical protein